MTAGGNTPKMVGDHADLTVTPAEGVRVIVVDSVEDGHALFHG